MTNPDSRQFLEWKPAVYDHRKVFRASLMAAKRFTQKQALYKRIPDTNLAGKMIMFGMRGTGGSIVAKYLEIYGCPDIVQIDHENQLFDIVASIPVKGILFWYASDARKSLDVIHRLNSNRQLPRRPIMIICPGAEAQTSLRNTDIPVLYDKVEEIPYSRLEFADKLNEWFACEQDERDSLTILYKVRRLIRSTAKGSDPVIDENQIIEQLQPLMNRPHGRYWVDVELASYHLAMQQWDHAARLIEPLFNKAAPVAVHPMMMRASLLAATKSPTEGAQWLIAQLKERRLSADQFLQMGQLIIKWKHPDALSLFLDYWYHRADIAKDAQYAFLIAMYLKMVDDIVQSHDYLKYAIAKAPFRWEFLTAMAENRLAAKDYRLAEHYWVVAKHHPYAEPLIWSVGLIRAHYGQKRIRYADGLLAAMLKKYPHDERLLQLKKLYVDDRVDQIKKPA